MHNPSGLPDKEFKENLRLPPMWMQSCDCGYEQWIRKEVRPRASFRFMEHWGSRAL
tara:strand:+ start:4996 stop:5163 length:168 start_codon:yes stop_codon:yes gene_type:complete